MKTKVIDFFKYKAGGHKWRRNYFLPNKDDIISIKINGEERTISRQIQANFVTILKRFKRFTVIG